MASARILPRVRYDSIAQGFSTVKPSGLQVARDRHFREDGTTFPAATAKAATLPAQTAQPEPGSSQAASGGRKQQANHCYQHQKRRFRKRSEYQPAPGTLWCNSRHRHGRGGSHTPKEIFRILGKFLELDRYRNSYRTKPPAEGVGRMPGAQSGRVGGGPIGSRLS